MKRSASVALVLAVSATLLTGCKQDETKAADCRRDDKQACQTSGGHGGAYVPVHAGNGAAGGHPSAGATAGAAGVGAAAGLAAGAAVARGGFGGSAAAHAGGGS